ncbi:hypothetical protein GLAREA_05033 [Glarea lozoyensis ATCC 20868]|uniref:Uncharacterized protein n=1 Tax=Glarea lozoyensis (strain ATCC 20868 / MF5171) TaxID=1116229 RepID=S3DUR4_GLAL2|nr:uncharacterized protein GLAREA_05033 [Glarea lozoyensis ATCC 20868]EPE35696.1 hypothetical protein GLAREA_05033 [Glarea lozoyensis ATCC 20868]
MSLEALPQDDTFLPSTLRVMRGIDSLPQVAANFPTLEEKALRSPSELTEYERRQLLDFPTIKIEIENTAKTTSKSRDELFNLVLTDIQSLSDDELGLVERNFWSIQTDEELFKHVRGQTTGSPESVARIHKARESLYLPNELKCMSTACIELIRRNKKNRDDEQRKWGGHNPSTEPAWMLSLTQKFHHNPSLTCWGYIALFDAGAQKVDAETLDRFNRTIQGLFSETMRHNGIYRNLLNKKWKFLNFNIPEGVYPSETDNSALREAFHTLITKPEEYNAPLGIDDRSPAERLSLHNGYLTNTFIVINKICIDSVLSDSRRVDDMRFLAFEAGFPEQGRSYVEGYKGWTWVRLEQLVDSFYAERMSGGRGMDEIRKAAQGSKNEAFASMDSEEAKIWTASTGMTGPLPESILGKKRRARQA